MNQAQSVIDCVAGCFDKDEYSDLTIKCQDKSWKVHRVIVCSQSKVLRAACMGFFKEAITGVIDLEDDDPKAVEVMLNYFYTGKYDVSLEEGQELRQQLLLQSLTYTLADKYDMPALMGVTKKRFKSTLNMKPTLEEFVLVASDVYTTPALTDGFRAIIVEYARWNLREMTQGIDNLDCLQALLQDVPDFAFEVLRTFINDPLRGKCSFCGPNQSAEALQARCKSCGRGGLTMSR